MKFRQIFSIATRYAFGWGNGYLSPFLSTLSTLALILAVCLLTIVLSIMNGFDKEMRERILWFIPHIVAHETIVSDKLSEHHGDFLSHPEIVEVEYFKTADALVFRPRGAQPRAQPLAATCSHGHHTPPRRPRAREACPLPYVGLARLAA